MKKIMIGYLCPLLVSLIVLAGCSKSSSSPSTQQQGDSAAITIGTWSVASYTEKGEDKTSDFNGMIFHFQTSGSLDVSGSTSATGTWLSTPATAGYYGGPPSLATFTISLGNDKPLSNLSKVWNVADSSNTLLKLDNKEPVEDEHVTFSKR